MSSLSKFSQSHIALERKKSPVPSHIDRIVGIVNCKIPYGEFLITKEDLVLPTGED